MLTRYILKRWTWPLLGGLLFYGCLLLAQELVALSKEIFSQGAAFHWLGPMLATALPEILGMVLPMASVLGGLLGTQHLMEGSELVAAQGLGAGKRTWVLPWAILSAGLVLGATFNAHILVPKVSQVQQDFRNRMAEEAKTRFLRPGAPPWYPPGAPGSALWVAPDGAVHLMEVSPQGVQHLVASSMTYALQEHPDGSWDVQVVLQGLQGALYQREGSAVVHLHQERQVLNYTFASVARLLPPTPLRNLTTAELKTKDTPQARLELALRFSLPLATAALLLLGIGLGFGHPRFYKGGAILRSMAVIITYYLVLQFAENLYLNQKLHTVAPILALPLLFGLGGWLLLWHRLRPHHPSRLGRRMESWWPSFGEKSKDGSEPEEKKTVKEIAGSGRRGILTGWSNRAWLRNWVACSGGLLVLSFLGEYANLAGDLSRNHVSFRFFLAYWFWNLPPFLQLALPISFLLGTVLTLSDAAMSREWVALRAGGVSLAQWVWAARWVWGGALLLSLLVQVWLAPRSVGPSNALYRRILNRPNKTGQVKPWANFSNTGVLWHMDERMRWGFPLKPPGEAPILLRWRMGDRNTDALAWGAHQFVQGPEADRLFPDRSLRDYATAEEAPTLDLARWQRWAPDPERAVLFWSRILGWLAGPCLVLAMLSYAFPGPRQGRGQALGAAVVAGLLFWGLQILFGGAARAGELPSLWGVLAPLCLLLGFGFTRLGRLRT